MNLTNADIKNLKDKKYRRDNGLFIVEGDKFCLDLKKYNVDIIYTITTNKTLKDMPNIELVSEKMFSSLSSIFLKSLFRKERFGLTISV